MKRKFWTTFFISLVCFSVLFAMAGKHLSNKESAISLDEDEMKDTFGDEDEILVLLMGIDDNDGIGV